MKEPIVLYVTITKSGPQRMVVRSWMNHERKEVEYEYKDAGWFITLDRFNISLYVGETDPGIKAGDAVKITIEKASQLKVVQNF
jgi:hypothetical protein